MKSFVLASFLALAIPHAGAAVVNVEFQFTPFTGDAATAETVTSVPGKAQVFINGVPFDATEIEEKEMPVLFDDHQVAPSVWVTMAHAGPMVRKGKNRIRVEFVPADPAKPYNAHLRWASIIDEATTQDAGGVATATNQAGEGVDARQELKGNVMFEREFVADFATAQPWHAYSAVTVLADDDKQKLAALLKTRAEWFKPEFAEFYKALERNAAVPIEELRKAGCVEAAYKAGVRVPVPAANELQFTPSGGPEMIITRKGGPLYGVDEKMFAAIKDEETQMCAGMALLVVYPKQVAAVRAPDGTWEIAY